MRIRSWKTLTRKSARPRPCVPAARLRVESLEARDVPAAAVLDLTTAGANGAINDAIFQQSGPVGTLQPFVRLQRNGVEQGYNTDARPVQFDTDKNSAVTHSLLLQNVPLVTIGTTAYRQFVLDVNQRTNKPSQSLISLDELRIFTGDSRMLTGYDTATSMLTGATLVYDLDAGGDNAVLLDARLNNSIDSADMVLYVPDSAFFVGTYVYVYSKFGVTNAANDGYEQWAVLPTTPTTFGSIRGTVFQDFNGAPVGGLQGFVVYIDSPDPNNVNGNGVLDWTDGNGNGVWDPGEGEQWTTTDANGHYVLSGLTAGTYNIRVVVPPSGGFVPVGGITLFTPTLGPGGNDTDVDFHFVVPT
jgi:hypothetical protein